jgi:competence protein ComEA
MRKSILILTFLCLTTFGLNSSVFAEQPTQPTHPEAQGQADQVDLNIAGLYALKSLKGIGKKLAQRIIDDRKANGPYSSVDQLKRVRGIGKKTVEKNRSRMRVSMPKPNTSKPNTPKPNTPKPNQDSAKSITL